MLHPRRHGECIAQGKATLNVLPTDAEWFGVTYREDKPQVMQALKRLHAQGAYPTPLWKWGSNLF